MKEDTLGLDFDGLFLRHRLWDFTYLAFYTFFRLPRWLERRINPKEISGASESIQKLKKRFDQRIYIVTKCNSVIAERTISWLVQRGVISPQGLPEDHISFCKTRAEKNAICEKLGINYFVDDRVDVLENLTSVHNRILFMPRRKELSRLRGCQTDIKIVYSWKELCEYLEP